jgi:hypothetical protein
MGKRAQGIDYRWQVGKTRGEFAAYCWTKPCLRTLGGCGAAAGEYCVTSRGKRAAVPHQARWPRIGEIHPGRAG